LTHFDLMVIEKRIFEICLLKTMKNFTRENQQYYIWVCRENGKGADDIHKELVIAEGTKALSKRTIYRWIEAFEAGQSSIEDAPRSGRPREAVTPSNVNIVEDLISNDPHISIESIQEVIPISTGSTETILHNELSVKKVCAKWVPHVLTNAAPHK
jgi:transposase